MLKAYALIPKTNDTVTIALVKDNLGFIYSKLNMDEQALPYMNDALELREALGDLLKIYASKKNLSQFYKDRGKLLKANEYAFEAYNVAKKTKSASYREDALGFLIELGNSEYAQLYKKINDSLSNIRLKEENKFALIRYEVSEYKRKTLESQLKEEEQRVLKFVYLAIAGLILITSIFIYFQLKVKHKKDTLQQVYNTESHISKKVHDEVANDVFQVLTKLESETNFGEGLIDDLERVYNKTRDISKEHNVLDFKGDFKDALSDLILSFNSENISIISKGLQEIQWSNISKVKKTTIYKVLQELLINMKKHSQASVAALTFNMENKQYIISYSDNGIGCEIKKNTGLQNVENRIASINGTITFESEIDKGFKAKIIV